MILGQALALPAGQDVVLFKVPALQRLLLAAVERLGWKEWAKGPDILRKTGFPFHFFSCIFFVVFFFFFCKMSWFFHNL